MWSATTASDEGHRLAGDARPFLSYWSAPIAGLVALWMWLVFSYGGYIPLHWLPAGLALGLFGLVAALLGGYPQRPGQLSLAVLAAFGAYAIWVALSALWAESATRVWMESSRTFMYLLIVALALLYFTDPAARQVFRYLVMAAALAVLLACVVKLWTTADVLSLFQEKRFSYPVGASNHVGTLVLVSFWPLMWIASTPKERSLVRGLALGIATGLLGLALMTQSRGAVWSLGISLIFMFVISPARLRLLFYLVVPGLLMAYAFPQLNRYWLEGPDVVGGGVAAHTLLVATVVAAFMGMILALLERWVNVSLRMKAIFGSVIAIAVLGGAIYWGVSTTSEGGGPVNWASQTWRQFTGENHVDAAAQGASRFALVSSTGRVQIWRVAIEEFKDSPVVGVGADNFVFQYDRLRISESHKLQQAHSLELQVLGETGAVGGVLFFGGMLLCLGAWLWPRCTAGWRQARATWLGAAKKSPSEAGDDRSRSRASDRWCNPRWGNDPSEYGWEMALLGGAGFWLIHASVDWIWQMTGVTVPALLFMAAAIAGVDAKAGVLWPRLRRWLSVGGTVAACEIPSEMIDAPASPSEAISTPAAPVVPPPDVERYQTAAAPLTSPPPVPASLLARSVVPVAEQPGRAPLEREVSIRTQSLLSHVFRAAFVALAAVVLVATGLPYLSIQYQDSALAIADTDGLRAAKRAATARYLLPTDPSPYLTQAQIYERAATRALEQSGPAAAGAILDNLALAVGSYEKAIALESPDWSVHYHAGLAMLNLVRARATLEGWDIGQDTTTMTIPAGLQDWSSLAVLQSEPASPGLTPGSLAQDGRARAQAASLRDLSAAALINVTLGFLRDAKERNPLASQVDDAMALLRSLKPPAGT